jgi:hypothetical protein
VIKQISYPKADLTARIELIGQERTSVNAEDLEFMANLLMGLALSRREEISEARHLIANAIQGMMRGDR